MLLLLWYILAHKGINSKYLHWNCIWMWLSRLLYAHTDIYWAIWEQDVPCILSDHEPPQSSKCILQLVQFLNILMLRSNKKKFKEV